jgi:hypothetical protein
MAEAERVLTIERLDRLNRGFTVVSLIGPLELPTREQFVDALHRVALLGPQARVGLRFGPRRDTWAYREDDLAQWCDRLVTTTDEAPRDLVAKTMTGLGAASDVPVRFVLAGDHVLTIFDHALGDGPLLELLPASIIEIARGAEIPEIFSTARVRGALVAAVRGTYLRRPIAAISAIRARAHYRRSGPAPSPGSSLPSLQEPSYHYARSSPQQLRELKRLASSTSTPVSLTSLLLSLLRRSFEAQGLDVALEASLIVDGRRYLPKAYEALGNLVTGMPIRFGGPDEAASIDAQTKRMLDSSWPLATLALGALQAGLRAATPAPSLSAPVRVSLSSPGMSWRLTALPWLTSTERVAIFVPSPVPERQISVSAGVVGHQLHITASFNASSIDGDAVRRAIDALVHSPVSLASATV